MTNTHNILSVITARAGSKGIPNKNIKILSGKPLFMHSVISSQQSKYITKTIVSSNCPIIKKICEEENIEFVQRPELLSGDFSKNEEAVIHALNNSGDYSIVINLQPTSPYRSKGLIDKCIETYIKGNYDSLFTAKAYTPFFWQKINNKWEYVNGDCCKRPMRQELKETEMLLHDCGSIYITDVDTLRSTQCRIGSNPYVFEVSDLEAHQIDTMYDWKVIETLIGEQNE